MERETIGLIIGILLLVLMSVGGVWARGSEKKMWNNGICQYCRSTWKIFDVDSSGGRGYKCICPRHIWISYAVDKMITR